MLEPFRSEQITSVLPRNDPTSGPRAAISRRSDLMNVSQASTTRAAATGRACSSDRLALLALATRRTATQRTARTVSNLAAVECRVLELDRIAERGNDPCVVGMRHETLGCIRFFAGVDDRRF